MVLKNSLDIIFLVLSCLGLWRPDSWRGWKSPLYYVYTFISNGFFFYMAILTELTQIYMVLGDLKLTIEAALLSLSHLVQAVKVYTIFKKNIQIRSLVNQLDDEIFYNKCKESNEVIHSSLEGIISMIKIYLLLGNGTMAIWMVAPLTLATPTLPLLAYYPYDLSNPLMFKLTYIYQTVSSFINANNHMCLDLLVVTSLAIMAAQLDVLCHELKALGVDESDNAKSTEEAIAKCVKHHLAIVDFVAEIECLFSKNVFCQFAASTIILCVTAFKMTQTRNPTELVSMFLYIVGILFQLLLYCYNGHLIIEKSNQLSEAAYFSHWYKFPSVSSQKMLLRIMMRSQKPLSMTVGKIFKLSLGTFAAIVKSSYSYFAVLYQSQNK